MKTHLLSIFPLDAFDSYARVTMTAVQDTALPDILPQLMSRSDIVELLHRVDATEVEKVLTALDQGTLFQIAVSADEAFPLGTCRRSVSM